MTRTITVTNTKKIIEQLTARIEALENALRWISAKTDDRLAAEFARAALGDGNSKTTTCQTSQDVHPDRDDNLRPPSISPVLTRVSGL